MPLPRNPLARKGSGFCVFFGFIALWALLLVPSPAAKAGTLNLGLFSFELLIPGDINNPGVNVFDIGNLTGDLGAGGFALRPDFPAVSAGGTTFSIFLGDTGPGFFSPTDPVPFPDNVACDDAEFIATFSGSTFRPVDVNRLTVAVY